MGWSSNRDLDGVGAGLALKPAPEPRSKGRKRAVPEEPETLPLFDEATMKASSKPGAGASRLPGATVLPGAATRPSCIMVATPFRNRQCVAILRCFSMKI